MFDIGELMYERAKALFPINRSLTGDGVRETLNYIKRVLPELTIHQVPSGTPVCEGSFPVGNFLKASWLFNECLGCFERLVIQLKPRCLSIL